MRFWTAFLAAIFFTALPTVTFLTAFRDGAFFAAAFFRAPLRTAWTTRAVFGLYSMISFSVGRTTSIKPVTMRRRSSGAASGKAFSVALVTNSSTFWLTFSGAGFLRFFAQEMALEMICLITSPTAAPSIDVRRSNIAADYIVG